MSASKKDLKRKVKLINKIQKDENYEMDYLESYGYVLTYHNGSCHLSGRMSKKQFNVYLDGIIAGLAMSPYM